MAKTKHSGTEELLFAAALAGGGYLLYRHYQTQLAAAAASTTPAASSTSTTAGGGVINQLSPPPPGTTANPAPTSSTSTTSTPTSPGSTNQVLIPAVPLNAPPTVVGTENGTTIIEENPIQTPYGTVIPSQTVVFPDPQTGAEIPVVTTPQVQTPTVISVTNPTTSGGLQTSTQICPSGTPYADNNPMWIGGKSQNYATMQAGLAAAFTWLKALQASVGWNTFTVDNISYHYDTANYDYIAQVGLTSAVASYPGVPAGLIDITNIDQMVATLKGFIHTIRGGSETAIPDACYVAAYNQVFGTSHSGL